jgi:hypothetical protein
MMGTKVTATVAVVIRVGHRPIVGREMPAHAAADPVNARQMGQGRRKVKGPARHVTV